MQRIKDNLTITRDLTTGGNAHTLGNAKVDGNLLIGGWIDAPNVRTPCKGLFASVDILYDAYPHPQPGWWALVGATIPAEVYESYLGKWVDTGQLGGETTVNLDNYDRLIDNIRQELYVHADDIATLDEKIDNVPHPVTIGDTIEADLIISDNEGVRLLTVADGHIATEDFDSREMYEQMQVLSDKVSQVSSAEKFKHPVTVRDTDVAELVIALEDGTPVLTVNNGHITTTAFDSSKVVGKDTMTGARISVLGDSISTFGSTEGCSDNYYPNGDLTEREQMWWSQVAQDLGLQINRISAVGGATVTKANADWVTARATSLASDGRTGQPPDIVIILCGINDWQRNIPIGTLGDEVTATPTTFIPSYRKLIDTVRDTYPQAKVYCCTPCKAWYGDLSQADPPVLRNGADQASYANAIKACAALHGVDCIDLWGDSGLTREMGQCLTIDALHPNAEGHRMIANIIKNKIKH